jgi:hypothetical protein
MFATAFLLLSTAAFYVDQSTAYPTGPPVSTIYDLCQTMTPQHNVMAHYRCTVSTDVQRQLLHCRTAGLGEYKCSRHGDIYWIFDRGPQAEHDDILVRVVQQDQQ